MVNAAFAKDVASPPGITLRGGDALDGYENPPPFDPTLDEVTDTYLGRYSGGLTFLDAASWRYYLPHLIEYTVRHFGQFTDVCDALLNNLRPPDREPPRLASLTPDQERAVTAFLELLAFSESSAHRDFACQVLEEWWIAGALYRKRAEHGEMGAGS
ncbi:MAG: hypothetical protein K2Q17_04415 [Nitrospiraceae bacterium]|uniref:DUF6714 family protein n=1 Tax=Nitrospira cf. moscoviensis SBR1015 TaxID=96242 RepID=UPI000A0A95A6|nr:DUF6714 family protein [Nitrospira cf. moscoviensis SBR1015]MBY0246893.1 hypothetical protein [Nitrospiraceae bacterium]OQW36281.1 MAG: hypothetical protein A4E20_07195 [Nitrospira sp. SG-bin2]